jgi:hypothetical protein
MVEVAIGDDTCGQSVDDVAALNLRDSCASGNFGIC